MYRFDLISVSFDTTVEPRRMPESRDRIARPIHIAAVYAQCRAGVVRVLSNEEEDLLGSLPRSVPSPTYEHRARRGGAIRRGRVENRSVTRRGLNLGGENSHASIVVRGRGRLTNSVLPSWYPRTPLRDVTSVVRAIERRRGRLGDVDSRQFHTSLSINQTRQNPPIPISGVQLKHNLIESPPIAVIKSKPVSPDVDKLSSILLGVANESGKDPEFLTTRKKLLSCIDTVEKVVKEELQKIKRTPNAKRAERERKVRT